jgi:hypothetical protein
MEKVMLSDPETEPNKDGQVPKLSGGLQADLPTPDVYFMLLNFDVVPLVLYMSQ